MKNSSNEHYSFTVTSDRHLHIYQHILDNEIVDITATVINNFYYRENKSNHTKIKTDKISQKLIPFYDEMIKNAVNRMWGNNTMRLDLPHNPQKTIREFNQGTDINRFYAIKIHSLLSYLLPAYWKYMNQSTGIASGRLTYDLYQIPLNSSSTQNYYVFRGTERGSYYVPNQFLFGGDMHDSKFFGVRHFIKWANQYLAKVPLAKLKKAKIDLKNKKN